MKKHSFTLIEMLVVIAIIGILAALLTPAVSSARASAKRTECISNKKQLITAATNYASDNHDMMVFQFVAKNKPFPYSWALRGYTNKQDKLGNIPLGKQYIMFKVMACPQTLPSDTDTGINQEEVSGMLYAKNFLDQDAGSSLKQSARFGKFYTENGNAITYDMVKMKSTLNLIMFADTFKQNGGFQDAWWRFSHKGEDGHYIATVHGDMTTVAYADGRAGALTASELANSPMAIKETIDQNFTKITKQ